MKKTIAMLLALLLVAIMLPVTAMAETLPVADATTGVTTLASGSYTLTDNVVLTGPIVITGTVTLDLNGYTITAGSNYEIDQDEGKGNQYDYIIGIKRGGNLTINATNGGGITAAGAAKAAIKVTTYNENDATTPATLVVNGGNIKGEWFGIAGNGQRHNTSITINNGVIEGMLGIYHPQNGVLTVAGGKIVGSETGIEMRSGTLNITGGFIETTSTTFSSVSNGNGSTTVGAAVAIAQHRTNQPITVNITGGSLIANGSDTKALSIEKTEITESTEKVEVKISNNAEIDGNIVRNTNKENWTLAISGGIVRGTIENNNTTEGISITGGTFYKDIEGIKKYIPEGSELVNDLSDGFTVKPKNTTIVIIQPTEEKPAEDQKNPSTGANDFVGIAAAMAIVSVMGAAVVSRKK